VFSIVLFAYLVLQTTFRTLPPFSHSIPRLRPLFFPLDHKSSLKTSLITPSPPLHPGDLRFTDPDKLCSLSLLPTYLYKRRAYSSDILILDRHKARPCGKSVGWWDGGTDYKGELGRFGGILGVGCEGYGDC